MEKYCKLSFVLTFENTFRFLSIIECFLLFVYILINEKNIECLNLIFKALHPCLTFGVQTLNSEQYITSYIWGKNLHAAVQHTVFYVKIIMLNGVSKLFKYVPFCLFRYNGTDPWSIGNQGRATYENKK